MLLRLVQELIGAIRHQISDVPNRLVALCGGTIEVDKARACGGSAQDWSIHVLNNAITTKYEEGIKFWRHKVVNKTGTQAVGLNALPSRDCRVVVKNEPGVIGLVEGGERLVQTYTVHLVIYML